jgi:hypothetical protein
VRIARALKLAAMCAGLVYAGAAPARAQNPDTMRPEESEAKAKQLIQQAIQALGGSAYLGVKDITRNGRIAQFSHTGEVTGYVSFVDFAKLPDRNRTEYSGKRNIISVWAGDQAWELDRGGVQESPADVAARNQEGLKKNVDMLFRSRLNEKGLAFRYAGNENVDLRQVDWVEVVDSEGRTMRIAIDRQTRLPSRAVYQTRDPASRERNEEIEYFSNYHTFQGVETPLQLARDRNGQKVYQVFFEDCKYNTSLSEDLFTRQSLEQRFGQLNKGKKVKEKN